MKSHVGAWAPAALYMVLIWVLSSQSFIPISLDEVPLRDKGVHMMEYFVLGVLLAHATAHSWPHRRGWRTMALAWLIATLFGLSDEIHQALVPGRDADVLDLVADAIGAFFGVAVHGVQAFFRNRFFGSVAAA